MADGSKVAYLRAAGIVERGIDDAVYLAEAEGEAIYRLNATGAALWRLLAAPVRLNEAASLFHQAFPERDRAEIEAELARLIQALRHRGLIVEAE